MRQSLFADVALCLSLFHGTPLVEALAFPQLQIRDRNSVPEAVRWLSNLLRKDVGLEKRQNTTTAAAQDSTCYEDAWYQFIRNLNGNVAFCRAYMDYPNVTAVVDYIPTSTITQTFTTRVITDIVTLRTNDQTTVTVTSTVPAVAKRNAEARPEITARAAFDRAEIASVFAMFKRQNAAAVNSSAPDDSQQAAMSSAFSSACSCQEYGGSTVTSTYTDNPAYTTLQAFGVTTTTLTTTRTGNPRVTTTTKVVTASPASSSATDSGAPAAPSVGSSSGGGAASALPAANANATTATATSSASGAPTPTSPPMTCPDQDGDTLSQMIGNERFVYTLNCSTELTTPNFYGALYYQTFSQCISACSVADANFSSPVCQGVSYFNSPNVDGYNCFLKTSGNGGVPMVGVDSAILLRIVMGVSDSDADGTTTEAVPFTTATPTANASELSSSMSNVINNSSNSMPIITPEPIPVSGLLVNVPGATAYSTFVSDGSTYSTGTQFSTYFSSNGVWYSSYYTSYTLAWASATTEYAYGSQATQIASINQTSSSENTGASGEYSILQNQTSYTFYPGGYNQTEVLTNLTYAANGTEISSSATTNYYSYQTAAGGNGGGSAGLEIGSISTVPASLTSTSQFSTQTVISNSYGASFESGNAGSGAAAAGSGGPTVLATTVTNSAGTAFSSGYLIFGQAGGTASESSFVASGSIDSGGFPVSTSVTVIVNSAGIADASGNAGAGSVTSAPVVVSTSITVILNTGGSAYSSGFVASGIISGTAGESQTAASGEIASSTRGSFSNSGAPRFGTLETSSPLLGTAPLGTGPTPYMPPGTAPLLSTGPSASFSNSGAPRSGIIETLTPAGTAPLGTAPTPYVPPGTAPAGTGASLSFSNNGAPRSGTYEPSAMPFGTAPLGTTPTGYLPAGTAPTAYSFSDTNAPRVGTGLTSPVGTGNTLPPLSTGPSPYPALSTGISPASLSFTNSAGNRTGEYPTGGPSSGPALISGPSHGSIIILPGPSSGVPATVASNTTAAPLLPTASGYPSFSNSGAPRQPFPLESSGAPLPSENITLPAPTASVGFPASSGFPPFSNSGAPREGSYLTPPPGTAPLGTAPLGTSPPGTVPPVIPIFATGTAPVLPPIPTTCANMTVATTTFFYTTTVFGCYSTCAPAYGYGSGPQSFGPPVFHNGPEIPAPSGP